MLSRISTVRLGRFSVLLPFLISSLMVLEILPANAVTVVEFQVPTTNSNPYGITEGPDGNLWFTEWVGNKIGRITTGGVITEFPVANGAPADITAGPDGNLWFTEWGGNKIGRITTGGVINEFPVPTAKSEPSGITEGPDGNLWFTEQFGNNIGRITTGGVINEFPVPTGGSWPSVITEGPDRNLWFTQYSGNKIGRITTGGIITEFPVPTAKSGPWGITAGPDGNLWFTEDVGNKIGRITTGGIITEFPVPTANSRPVDITEGPDGSLWFTEWVGNKIGRITTGGVITEFPVSTANRGPWGITAGPDGNLWFTETVGNIGQAIISCATPGTPSNPSPSNGATGVSTNPLFAWAPTQNTDSYDVYFGTSSNPPYAGNTTGSFSISGLSNNTTYYWKIVAKNKCGNSTSGPVWNFTTAGSAPAPCATPGTPSTPTPSNGSTGITTSQTLSWASCANTDSYDVYFGTSSNPPYVGNTTSTSYSSSGLSNSTTYYWKIVAKNSCGNSTSGPVWSFTTGNNGTAKHTWNTTYSTTASISGIGSSSGVTYGNLTLNDNGTFNLYDATGGYTYTGTYVYTTGKGKQNDRVRFTLDQNGVNELKTMLTVLAQDYAAGGGVEVSNINFQFNPPANLTITIPKKTNLPSSLKVIIRGKVSAILKGKNTNKSFSYSCIIAFQPGTLPPAAPSNLQANSNFGSCACVGGQISLSWTDNSNNETGFRIERSLSPGSGFTEIATVGAGITSYNDIAIGGNASTVYYYYRVRAYNGAGNSAYSNTASYCAVEC